ncbi:MAG TPA: cytochrome c [Candidatus Acidoferrum sp.]|jgi:mono/diheme cytochrome c family protein
MKSTCKTILICSAFVLAGCRVSKPGGVEGEMMKEMKHKITVGGKDTPNPVAATPENIAEGKEHFGHHCGICHGLDGEATGVPFAKQMSPPIPSLSSADVQDYKDGQLKWIIENGINPSGMPSWKGILSDEEMWKIVDFMRHLPPKGSLGIPPIYKEEQEEHQQMQKDHDTH